MKNTRACRPQQGEVLIRKTLKELADELDPMNSGASTAPRWCAWMPSIEVTRSARAANGPHPQVALEVSRGHTHLFQQM
jgi:hypothetical protein